MTAFPILFASTILLTGFSISKLHAQPNEGGAPSNQKDDAKAEWQTYKNPRFGMSLPVPPGMTAQRPPENGDGQTFRSADGKAELLTWGSFNIDGIGDVEKRFESALVEPGRTITYKKKTEKWFVISGTRKDGTAFYERYDADKKFCAGWLITYPQADEKSYAPIVERIAKDYSANLGKGTDITESN